MPFALNDRIFLGEGLFETLKVKQAKPCDADLHWHRLIHAAPKLGIPFSLSYAQWVEYLLQIIHQEQLINGGLKVIISAGPAARGMAEYGQECQMQAYTFLYQKNSQPLSLISAPWVRDKNNPLYQVKSTNYLEAILARRHAQALGKDDALFFNTDQQATETTCANLFVIHKQRVLTPPLADGVLPGITRMRLISVARKCQVSCEEVSLSRAQLLKADAIFVTNVLQGIQMVISLDGVSFATDNPLAMYLKDALQDQIYR